MTKPKTKKKSKYATFCGSCRYHMDTKHKDLRKVCSELGCISTSPSCEKYECNVFAIASYDEAFKPLARLMRQLPTDKIPILYDLIAHEKRNRIKGFTFHEKVAVRYRGTLADDYLSHYAKARIYKVTPECVFLVSDTGMLFTVLPSSVVKWEKFKEIRLTLIAQRRTNDPKTDYQCLRSKNGIVRDIDTVSDVTSHKKVKGAGRIKLTTLNMQIESGTIPFFDLPDLDSKSSKKLGSVKSVNGSRVISIDRDEPVKKKKVVAVEPVKKKKKSGVK